MIDTPQILHTKPQLTAVIHLTIPKDQIREAMHPGLTELISTLATQGIKPAGAWFDHHFKIVDDSWDFEICVPVSVPVKAVGRVRPSEWPAMKVARTVYHGDYEGLYEAWEEFLEWIDRNKLTTAQDQYQRYTVGAGIYARSKQMAHGTFQALVMRVENKPPNHVLQQTAVGRRGCKQRVSWPPSLSFGR